MPRFLLATLLLSPLATIRAEDVHDHPVHSDFQSKPTVVRVLVPDTYAERTDNRRFQVLYLLPVEAGESRHWGDALAEVKQLDLHNKHELICVYPTFSHLPWYADHPTDPGIQQESYFLQDVVPLIDRSYATQASPQGRLLVGFSKSGWGAFSLLLRHSQRFGRAAAWDAPLEMAAPNRYGMEPIFGTQENFEAYRISSLLAEVDVEAFSSTPRLIHLGYDNFRTHHLKTEERLVERQIPHLFHDGPRRKHHWESGWLATAVWLLTQTSYSSVQRQQATASGSAP